MRAPAEAKRLLKRAPFLWRTIRRLREKISVRPFKRDTWERTQLLAQPMHFSQVVNVLRYTKTSGTAYAATKHPAGYHTIDLCGEILPGQRNPKDRLAAIPLDFTGRSVLDIGCNQGGMIFGLQEKLKWGVGLDYDHRMINCCNKIRQVKGVANTHFYVLDIDKEPLEIIRDYLPEEKVDVIFLLSVCMWVKRWKPLMDLCGRLSDIMVFESNGTGKQQDEQRNYLGTVFRDVTMIQEKSEDDPDQKRRMLYLAKT